jgi:hypothetical protein
MRLVACALVSVAVAACGAFGATPSTGDGDGGIAADGGAGGEGGASLYCDTVQAKRCLDFDRDSERVSPFGFDAVLPFEGSGSLEVDDGGATSSPSSLHALTPDGGKAVAEIHVVPVPSKVTASVSILPEVVDRGTSNASSSHVLSVQCVSGDSGSVYLKVTSEGFLGISQPGSSIDRQLAPLATGAWRRLSLTLDGIGSAAVTATASLDGAVVFGPEVVPTPLQACDARGLSVRLGSNIANSGPTADWRLRYDDFVVDY